jgi:hypothetical protein
MKIEGFIVERDYKSPEDEAIRFYCDKHGIDLMEVQYSKKLTPTILEGYVPCGSIPWMAQILGNITPDYYPEYLKDYLNRKVWETDKWPLGKKVFIKPADAHKRFNGFITYGTYRKKKRGPYWCSDIVHFENEWRYYVAHGKVVVAEWYKGGEKEKPEAPSIDHIGLSEDLFATLDFGTVDGKLTLVESHEPLAAGWYGTDHDKYAEWLAAGWFNRDKWLKDD